MKRRAFIACALAPAAGLTLGPGPALAHHGWSSFDQERPLYLEGRAARVAWRNPHVELQLDLGPEPLKLPADLASRALPAQSAPATSRAPPPVQKNCLRDTRLTHAS